MRALTIALGAGAGFCVLLGSRAVLAQSGAAPAPAPTLAQQAQGGGTFSIWGLFLQSFDLFTILILVGSVAALAIIVRCLIVVRRTLILPDETTAEIRRCIAERRWPELQQVVAQDEGFLGRVLHETLPKLRTNPMGVHEACEIAADNESAKRFKEVEWLGVIGNLGPLLGLAGTVWGMIIAFTAIGETGGQAAASQLSVGIAKALFHTFLGLTLAIPSLFFYGVFRERLDRLCTEGTMLATDSVDEIANAIATDA